MLEQNAVELAQTFLSLGFDAEKFRSTERNWETRISINGKTVLVDILNKDAREGFNMLIRGENSKTPTCVRSIYLLEGKTKEERAASALRYFEKL